MKKKIKDLTIAELNAFCDKHYYSTENGSCENCPLCSNFNEKYKIGHCDIGDEMGTIRDGVLETEVEVDEQSNFIKH